MHFISGEVHNFPKAVGEQGFLSHMNKKIPDFYSKRVERNSGLSSQL